MCKAVVLMMVRMLAVVLMLTTLAVLVSMLPMVPMLTTLAVGAAQHSTTTNNHHHQRYPHNQLIPRTSANARNRQNSAGKKRIPKLNASKAQAR